jgi:uncharacterized protein YndB with AHSA1/START domain
MALLTDVNRTASARACAEIEIYAPRRFVWDLHTNVNAWPRWQPDILFAVIEQPIAPGVAFRWHTHGMAVTSIVDAVEEAVRLRWRCSADETTWFHEWTFTDRSAGVHVRTSGSITGASVLADPAGSQTLLEQSLTFWLHRLKAAAESR